MRFQPEFHLKFSLSLPIALFAAQGAFAQGAHVDAKPYSKVTDERLEHPDAGDWLMYRRTYDGSGYSPLNQITPSNIRRLTLAWSVSTDLLGAHETTAIVNHGRMFITTPQNNIIAFDAKTGTQIWRYARKYPDGLFQLHPTNRGVALYGDYVYDRLAGINFLDPARDAPLQVSNTPETRSPEELHRFRRSRSDLAVDDNLPRTIQL